MPPQNPYQPQQQPPLNPDPAPISGPIPPQPSPQLAPPLQAGPQPPVNPAYAYPPQQPQSYQQPAYTPQDQPSNSLAIVGLILAFFFAPVGLILSIIAVKKAKTSLSKTLGIVGIAVSALGTLLAIGVIVALIITTSAGIQGKARDTERTTDLRQLQSQLEAYYADKGQYPSNNDLGTSSTGNVAWIAANMHGLDKAALSDPQGTPGDYSLAVTGNGTAHKYTYEPTNSAGAPCDDTINNACIMYRLIAVPTPGVNGNIKFDSIN